MGQYTDLTQSERQILPLIARAWKENGENPLILIMWPDDSSYNRFRARLDGIGLGGQVRDVPAEQMFYCQLHMKGYLNVSFSPREDLNVSVTKRGLDFCRYERMGFVRRMINDLLYDLAPEQTCSSRMLWIAVTAVIAALASQIVPYVIGLLWRP